MYILDVMETCSSTALSSVLPVVKTIMVLIQFTVPIILIVSFSIEFIKLSVNPEDKNGFRKLLNKLLAAIIIFMLPVLMNAIMGVAGESTEFSNCWNKVPSLIRVNNAEDGEYATTDEDKDEHYSKPEAPNENKNPDHKPEARTFDD